jgi:hypothetical protein
MTTKHKILEEIHESFVSGQNKQAVELIEEQELYSFWADYADYLYLYSEGCRFSYFRDAVIVYHRLKYR